MISTDLEQCDETHFQNTDYEQAFYKAYESSYIYCIKKDDPIHLVGTRDWAV